MSAESTGERRWLTLGREIARLRERAGLSQRELAELVGGVALAYFGIVEIGLRRPRPAVLRRAAPILGVPYERLADLADFGASPAAPRVPLPYEEVHAGDDAVMVDAVEEPDGARRRGALMRLRVRGDCMAPAIEPGDLVVVDLDAEPEDGDVVAARTEAGSVLRRYHRGRGGAVELVTDNPGAGGELAPLVPGAGLHPVVDVHKGRPRRPRGSR